MTTQQRLRAIVPFAWIGAACVVGGGAVAAAIAPAPTEHGVWAVAYLVLVGGVAQFVLGAGQAWLGARVPSSKLIAIEAVGWNAGNALVLAGTILDVSAMVDVGGAMLVVVLALVASHVRRGTVDAERSPASRRWLAYGFRAVLVLLLVSIPIGLVLERVRPA